MQCLVSSRFCCSALAVFSLACSGHRGAMKEPEARQEPPAPVRDVDGETAPPFAPPDAPLVQEDDPIWPALVEYQSAMQARSEERKDVRLVFHPWIRLESSEVTSLFPGLRFAALAYDMKRHPEATGAVHLPFGLGDTVAVDPTDGRIVARLWHCGNSDDYGQLLAQRRVQIRDQREAETVWMAFNQLTLRQWWRWTAAPIRRSATVWDLGVWDLGDETRDRSHYEVRLDEDGYVVSGRLSSEGIGTKEADSR